MYDTQAASATCTDLSALRNIVEDIQRFSVHSNQSRSYTACVATKITTKKITAGVAVKLSVMWTVLANRSFLGTHGSGP